MMARVTFLQLCLVYLMCSFWEKEDLVRYFHLFVTLRISFSNVLCLNHSLKMSCGLEIVKVAITIKLEFWFHHHDLSLFSSCKKP